MPGSAVVSFTRDDLTITVVDVEAADSVMVARALLDGCRALAKAGFGEVGDPGPLSAYGGALGEVPEDEADVEALRPSIPASPPKRRVGF